MLSLGPGGAVGRAVPHRPVREQGVWCGRCVCECTRVCLYTPVRMCAAHACTRERTRVTVHVCAWPAFSGGDRP